LNDNTPAFAKDFKILLKELTLASSGRSKAQKKDTTTAPPNEGKSLNISKIKKAVLGLDIFKYSKAPQTNIKYLQFAFDLIVLCTRECCKLVEPSLFRKIEFNENFKHTGDGALIVFDTPLEALVFNCYFTYFLHLINSQILLERLILALSASTDTLSEKALEKKHRIIVRSVITYDEAFEYEGVAATGAGKYFGKSVTNCARLLSKDSLNRFLIDESTQEHFFNLFHGIENIPSYDVATIAHIRSEHTGSTPGDALISNLFKPILSEFHKRHNSFIQCHARQLDEMSAKKDQLSAFNTEVKVIFSSNEMLHITKDILLQYLSPSDAKFNSDLLIKKNNNLPDYLLITVGNLNTQGLADSRPVMAPSL
jgi:hypothetical protein